MILLLILMSLLGLTVVHADVQPSWYFVDFQQEDWFANNNTDLRYNHTNKYIGQVQFGPDNYFYNRNGAGWNGNFSIVITTPFDGFYLRHVEDSTKTFNAWVDLLLNGAFMERADTDETAFNYSVPWGAGRPLFQFYITVQPRFDDPNYFQGTYFLPLNIAIYIDYELDTEVLLEESLFNILVYFVEPSSGSGGNGGGGGSGNEVFTNLWVDRYATAEGVDIPTLQTTGSSLVVGSVHFTSTDKKNNSSYSIDIYPGEDPLGDFAFHKVGTSGTIIPYKVFVTPERAITTLQGTPAYGSQASAFTVPVTTRSAAGFWQDFFEVGITNMNYDNLSFTAGDYTSLIKIELKKD